MESRSGTRFGPYELRALLGRGGMGEVYEAYDTVKDRVVAVKLLPVELAKDPVYQQRFRRESQAAARLAEPHVIPIHDWGEIDGVLYIDMRLVRGHDLKSVLRRQGPMPAARAIGIIEQIGAALDAAHAEGLVHRDVKPANILVTPSDFAYLADFGIARSENDPNVTATGAAIGSYSYIAPERFDTGTVRGTADVYSLACVLYECLTGTQPFQADGMSKLIRSHLSTPPPRPSVTMSGVPAALDEVVSRGMAKNPSDRYPTAGGLAAAAKAALTARPAGAPTDRIGKVAAPPTITFPSVEPAPPSGRMPGRPGSVAAQGGREVRPAVAGPAPQHRQARVDPSRQQPRKFAPAPFAPAGTNHAGPVKPETLGPERDKPGTGRSVAHRAAPDDAITEKRPASAPARPVEPVRPATPARPPTGRPEPVRQEFRQDAGRGVAQEPDTTKLDGDQLDVRMSEALRRQATTQKPEPKAAAASAPPPARRRSPLLRAFMIGAGVVVAVAAAGLVGWGVRDVLSVETPEVPSVQLPPDATTCPVRYPALRGFTASAIGTRATSCPFAEEVRKAYAEAPDGADPNRTVRAHSPIVDKHFEMTCTMLDRIVTCKGGDNAVVYVY